MDTVVCTDFNESEIRDIPKPEPASDEVLVSVNIVQPSVTECMRYQGVEISRIEDVRRRLEQGSARLFGHEFSGTVVERGEDVEDLQEGDRVYAPGKVVCNDCTYCNNNYSHFCKNKEHLGSDRPGALAEYIAVPEQTLCKIPSNVTDAEGAALQPLVSSFSSTYSADIKNGENVAVVGNGVMGFQCAQLALENGASDVFVIDVVPEKLEIAKEKGLRAINAREVDPVEEIRESTDGIGVDVVFEAVGGEQDHATSGEGSLAQAFEMVRYGGRVVQTSHISGDVAITPRTIRSKSVNWINPKKGVFSLSVTEDAGCYVAKLVSDGRVSIDDYITTQLDGLESFEKAVEITLNKEEHGALGPVQIRV